MNRTALTLMLVVPMLAAAQTSLTAPTPVPHEDVFSLRSEAPRAATRPRRALLIAGGTLFLASYTANSVPTTTMLLVQATACGISGRLCAPTPLLGYLPVLGPLLQIHFGGYPPGVAVLLSASQALGLLGIGAAYLFPEPVVVTGPTGRPLASVHLTPTGLAAEF